MYTFELDTDIMDGLLAQSKQPPIGTAIQTWHNGVIYETVLDEEHNETPDDKQFKFNPSMRING